MRLRCSELVEQITTVEERAAGARPRLTFRRLVASGARTGRRSPAQLQAAGGALARRR